MTTIHLVLHSHVDPVWLWPWQAGLDMALGTCRTACDLLDRHPDIVFTFGDAWAFHGIEQVDRGLFERIRRHVAEGRWEIAGGWWTQPDCNLPSGWGLAKQIELGRQYLEPRFGRFSRIGFNIDSFGHAASIPQIMRAGGQDRYVMMRPMPAQKQLPARLFRWRGWEGSPEVLTFRIATEYQARPPLEGRLPHIRSAMTDLPPGVTHTMCFIGVGDHGGGVTDKMVEWCRSNTDRIEGARLVFSSPSRFFDAVAGQADGLPLVTGELQYEAVGCYSVQRVVKTGVRRAEHLLRQVECCGAAADPEELTKAWRRVCFHQFHDTLGGTCIPSAYRQVEAQLGEAAAWADERLQLTLRERMAALPDDPMQRIVLLNASDRPFGGFIEFEPWREIAVSVPEYAILDERGDEIPCQALEPEALDAFGSRLLFAMQMTPGELRILRLDDRRSRVAAGGPVALEHAPDRIANSGGVEVRLTPAEQRLAFAGDGRVWPLPWLELIEDASDTWGHGQDRFAETAVDAAAWNPPSLIEAGPLRATLNQTGVIGQSPLRIEWRVYSTERFVEIILEVEWREAHKILKWTWPMAAPAAVGRLDGIPGSALSRDNDGVERPLRDWSLLRLDDGRRLGVVCPDVFALDATTARLRLTLLRAAVMAHHAPHGGVRPRRTFSDRGTHIFRFRVFAGADLSGDLLDQHAMVMQRPPIMADLTRGMPPLVDQGWYNPTRR